MEVTPPPSRPFEEVGVDFVGPLPKVSGYLYVCCVMDLFTGFVTAWPARETFAEDFMRNLVIPSNCPQSVRHDRGRSFTNAVVKHLLYVLHIYEMTSSGYHPQFNGTVERTNGTFAQEMCTTVRTKAAQWPTLVPIVVANINSSICTVRGETPFFLNHGRDYITPLAAAAGSLVAAPQRNLEQYRSYLLTSLQEHYALVQSKLRAARASIKARVDEDRREASFQIGDLVWLYTPLAHKKGELNPKYRPPWVGPMRITGQKGSVNYLLTNLTTGTALQSPPHVSRLKPYHPRDGRPQVTPHLLEDDNFNWDVESYLARVHQLSEGEQHYEALVPLAPAGSTIEHTIEVAKEVADVPTNHPKLNSLFKAIFKSYHKFLAKKKMIVEVLLIEGGQNHRYTWGQKKTRTAKNELLKALNDDAIFVTTERRTHWMLAIKDIQEANQLELFMRSVLLNFRRAFANEIYFAQYIERQQEEWQRAEPPMEAGDIEENPEGPELGDDF